jgi:ElaB/YqjD/DUF883 family membrane-anchored ribosome-binding protein
MGDVRKGTDEGINDVDKKKAESERRVSDLESILDAMSDLKGGVNQESVEQMKREAQEAFETQKREFEKAADDVHKQEKNLEERTDTLSEGIQDKDADAKRAQELGRGLQTDFTKKFISKIEQESQSESKEYQEQKKNLESTLKEAEKVMKDQERRAKKTPKFTI